MVASPMHIGARVGSTVVRGMPAIIIQLPRNVLASKDTARLPAIAVIPFLSCGGIDITSFNFEFSILLLKVKVFKCFGFSIKIEI